MINLLDFPFVDLLAELPPLVLLDSARPDQVLPFGVNNKDGVVGFGGMLAALDLQGEVGYDVLIGELNDDPSAGLFLYAQEFSVDLGLAEQMLAFSLTLNGVEIKGAIELRFVDEIRMIFVRSCIVLTRASLR